MLKGRCDEEGGEEERGEEGSQKRREWVLMRDIREELKDTAELLDAALSQSEVSEDWKKDKTALVDADERLKGFFEEKEADLDE